ncbi:MAG: ABC transporter ATP-binding protein [Cyanobacteria bacterium REEB459]|nr:ABC transporter ATP-binding protein [Cyanobacteria bacterium REEB459]
MITPEPGEPEPAAIAVTGLQKTYKDLAALKGISFRVQPGEIFGLIGPDGAGKTTTFQILAGVMAATAGEVRVLGTEPRRARRQLGYVSQRFSLYPDLSVAENLHYVGGLRRLPAAVLAERATQLLERVGLDRFSQRLAANLSGGMRQKLALCCALVTQPQVLLLDEPTTGVDPVSRREFWDLLAAVAATGVTVVTATPYLDEAERCHRLALIYGGEIQQTGTLEDLRQSLGLQRIELWTTPLERAEQALSATMTSRQAAAMVEIQPFGDRLDVLVKTADQGEQQIRASLAAAGLPLAALRHNQPTLENVFVHRLRQQGHDLAYPVFPAYRPGQEKHNTAIITQALSKSFGDFQAVKGVDITVHYGEIYGLLGANGAGKTTTIKMLCGLLPATEGAIELAGAQDRLDRPEVRSRIGYMSQKFTLYDDLTIRQNLEFYCGVYGVPRSLRQQKIDWVLETCGLVGREHLATGSLPGGWKQRVAFGASVMHEPDILFLDEPTSGVDPLARRQFWHLIRDFAQRGAAILVTTHYLEEAENCNQIALMVGGAIFIQGTPSQIKASQPGQLIELLSPQVQAASDHLKSYLEAWRVAIFGDRLHLVLDHPDQDLAVVHQRLAEAAIPVTAVRPIPFSLEDAFIGIVQRAERP